MLAKKSFGQHFLQDQRVIQKIIAAAEIKPGELVLEVGPGHGVLTQALVDAGAKVIAVEADRDLIPELERKFGQMAKIVLADILKFRISDLFRISNFGFRNYKLVSNLPYNIASAVIEKFLTADQPPSRLVIMVQREVADRILAKPGEMSVLSVACQLYAAVKRIVNVPPGAFRPMPKVESTVIRLETKPTPFNSPLIRGNRIGKRPLLFKEGLGVVGPEEVIALAKIGFRSRRKQLHRNLSDAKIATSEEVKAVLLEIGLKETARAQELAVDKWIELYERLP